MGPCSATGNHIENWIFKGYEGTTGEVLLNHHRWAAGIPANWVKAGFLNVRYVSALMKRWYQNHNVLFVMIYRLSHNGTMQALSSALEWEKWRSPSHDKSNVIMKPDSKVYLSCARVSPYHWVDHCQNPVKQWKDVHTKSMLSVLQCTKCLLHQLKVFAPPVPHTGQLVLFYQYNIHTQSLYSPSSQFAWLCISLHCEQKCEVYFCAAKTSLFSFIDNCFWSWSCFHLPVTSLISFCFFLCSAYLHLAMNAEQDKVCCYRVSSISPFPH